MVEYTSILNYVVSSTDKWAFQRLHSSLGKLVWPFAFSFFPSYKSINLGQIFKATVATFVDLPAELLLVAGSYLYRASDALHFILNSPHTGGLATGLLYKQPRLHYKEISVKNKSRYTDSIPRNGQRYNNTRYYRPCDFIRIVGAVKHFTHPLRPYVHFSEPKDPHCRKRFAFCL